MSAIGTPPPPGSSRLIPDRRRFRGFGFPITRSRDHQVNRSPLCSFVSFVVKDLVFNLGNLLQPSAYVPSARHPPSIGALLKTKVKVQFDRAVTERSKPFFYRFASLIGVIFLVFLPL